MISRDDLLKEAEEMGAALLPLSDVELILGMKEHLDDELKRAYLKGVKTTQLKLNKIIVKQAIDGSKPAQDMAINLLDQINMNGRI